MNKTFITFISFIFFFSCGVFLNLNPFSPKEKQLLEERVFWTNKAHISKKFDAVIIGDSRALRGINPSELSTFRTVYNYSFRSLELTVGFVSESLKLLKNQNSTLIIGLTPNSLVETANPNEHFFEYKNISFEERLLKTNLTVAKLLSPIKDRKYESKSRPKYTKTFHKNGFIATDLVETEIEKGLNTYEERFQTLKVSYSKLDKILKFLKEKNINVIFFRMPSCKEMVVIEDKYSGFNPKLVKEKIQSYGLKWLDINNPYQYDTYDASHLRPYSAMSFSKNLNTMIQHSF